MGKILDMRRTMGSQDVLPKGLVPIEYLESSGKQYINTLIVQDYDLEIDCTFMVLGPAVRFGVIYGCGYADSSSYNIIMRIQESNLGILNPWFASSSWSIPNVNAGIGIIKSTLKYGNFKANDINAAVPSVQGNLISSYIYLFAGNYSNAPWRNQSCRIFNFLIRKNNGEILIDLVPVRKGTTGYMYDKVSGQLYGNDGTVEFILGPDKVGGVNA